MPAYKRNLNLVDDGKDGKPPPAPRQAKRPVRRGAARRPRRRTPTGRRRSSARPVQGFAAVLP